MIDFYSWIILDSNNKFFSSNYPGRRFNKGFLKFLFGTDLYQRFAEISILEIRPNKNRSNSKIKCIIIVFSHTNVQILDYIVIYNTMSMVAKLFRFYKLLNNISFLRLASEYRQYYDTYGVEKYFILPYSLSMLKKFHYYFPVYNSWPYFSARVSMDKLDRYSEIHVKILYNQPHYILFQDQLKKNPNPKTPKILKVIIKKVSEMDPNNYPQEMELFNKELINLCERAIYKNKTKESKVKGQKKD